MFYFLFLTSELLFFNGTGNIKHIKNFHFAGIYLFKFYVQSLKKAQNFSGFSFSMFKLKIMIFEVYDT